MPHDRKGRLIEAGDFVKVRPYNTDQAVVGRVVHVQPAASTCNVQIVFPTPEPPVEGESSYGALLRGTVLTDYRGKALGFIKHDYTQADACELVLKADGSEPTPAEGGE